MDKEQAVLEAGRVFRANMGDVNALKRRIRARAEQAIEREVKIRQEAAARAIHFAYEMGATKSALREVTTKDHRGFQAYLSLGEQLARDESERPESPEPGAR